MVTQSKIKKYADKKAEKKTTIEFALAFLHVDKELYNFFPVVFPQLSIY